MEILAKLQLWSYEIDQTYYLVSDEYDDAVAFFKEEVALIAAKAVEVGTNAQDYFLQKFNEGVFVPRASYDPSDADEVWWVHLDIYYMRATLGKKGVPGEYECGRTPRSDAFVNAVKSIERENR
ncbi:hypothetical protein [Haladaptatus sp. NG-WS-4]